ncbi:MAG: DRTGG domain-containing protein [Dehalococcoidales bacterium]
MRTLFIVSAEEAAGKTALCAGLAINFMSGGKTVGYAGKNNDGDVAFMGKVLGAANVADAPDVIKGRDIVLVEGRLGPRVEEAKQTIGAAKDMKAGVIIVESYTGQDSKYIDIYKWFEKSLLGVVLNKVPASQLKSVKEKASAQFSAAGIKVLGVIPENRMLLAISIGELADVIKGKILNSPEKSGELVENYMLGAMVVGSGVDYFARKSGKAAIIHQDRPDMQLAALETPTKCLVLSGSPDKSGPIANVIQKAASRGIPVISTESKTPDIIATIDETILKNRLREDKKLAGLGELVKQGLDLKAVI